MIDDIPFIRHEPVYRKYELYFHVDTLSFEIIFPKDYLIFLRTIPRVQEFIEAAHQEFQFEKLWDINSDIVFGHDHCMTIPYSDGEFISLLAPVNKSNGRAISRSFVELFPLFHHIISTRRPEKNEKEQEMFLDTSLSSGFQYYGAAMTADLSYAFSLWIFQQNDELRMKVNSEVNKAMNSLHQKLNEQEAIDSSRSGLFEQGFVLEPPAGVYTSQFGILRQDESDFEPARRFGFKTFCHNLDHWKQQLVLLAGFTKICEIYRNS
jgi:hypothetical protein